MHALAWSGGRRNHADSMESANLLPDAGDDPSAKYKKGRTIWKIATKRDGAQLKKLLDAGQNSEESRSFLPA